MSDRLHAPAALTPGKEPPVPIGHEDGWRRSWSRRSGEEKNVLLLPGINHGRPARSLVTIMKELPRLH